MPELISTKSQRQNQNLRGVLSANYIQLQSLIISSTQEIIQSVHEELARNPALELHEEPDFSEDIERDDSETENWNQDFDKPYDEYESGEPKATEEKLDWDDYDVSLSLEQAAAEYAGDDPNIFATFLQSINQYRISGTLTANENEQLHKDLRILENSITNKSFSPDSPTFEVLEVSGNIQVVLIPTIADSLTFIKGHGKYSKKAEDFIARLIQRSVNLNNLAVEVLENLQGEFFRQSDFKKARLALIPIPPKKLLDFNIKFSLSLDKKLISKLGDLLVSCKFGVFPLSLFMQSNAAILRLWLHLGLPKEISKLNDQCEWVRQQAAERINILDSNDMRIDLLRPLLEINTTDIKNARKQLHK